MLKYYVAPKKNPINGKTQYYAQLMPVVPISIDEVCHDISEQSTMTAHDIKAVISALEEQAVKFLREGFSVSFGDLGSFRPTLRALGSLAPEEVKVSNIKRVHVVFQPSPFMVSSLSIQSPYVQLHNVDSEPAGPVPPESGGEQTI